MVANRFGLLAFFLSAALLLLAGCSDDAQNRLSVLSGPTMGTTWSVKYTGSPDQGVDELKEDIEKALEQINQQMSTYQSDSAISRFNRAPAGTVMPLPDDFVTVMKAALALSEQTGGAYDVTVGPLVNLWGFGPDKGALEKPTKKAIAKAKDRVGWKKLTLNDDGLLQPGDVYVDLSSIAKGFGVDKVTHVLKKHDIDNYLVEVGGELRAGGEKPHGQPWRVAVEQPIPGVREVEYIVDLKDRSVATSGDYRNFFQVDGTLYSHTLDPRTGYPVGHKLASVSVLDETAMMADGLATVMTVLGPEEGMAFAKRHELAVLFIVRTDEGVREVMSPAFRAVVEDQ